MSAEIDTRNTDEPICPHCGDEFGDAWEMFDFHQNKTEMDCGNCGKLVTIERDFHVTYSTEKGGAQ